MTKQLVRLALILILVSIACNLPARPAEPMPTPMAVAAIFITAAPNATATATPYQPIGPTSTPAPTATPLPTDTPQPTDTPAPAPEPTRIRLEPSGSGEVVNLLVLGSDFRPGAGFRTDTIILVSIHPKSGTVRLVSFPRDLYVTIPGWGDERINTAFPRGGFETLAATLEYNFGVRPKYYVMTNFDGFIQIINSMGGIDVHVGQYLRDKCDVYQGQGGYCTVEPGIVNMDGGLALWYIRSRYSSSDFDRLRRSQEVLGGIFRRLMARDVIGRLPEMYNNYQRSVETNIGIDEIIPLLPAASDVFSDSSRIRRYSIGPEHVYPYIAPSGASVLLPNYYTITETLREALAP